VARTGEDADQPFYRAFFPRSTAFSASADRVDLIMLTMSLHKHLVAAGMFESLEERGSSDHVPIYVRLDFGERLRAQRERLRAQRGFVKMHLRESIRNFPPSSGSGSKSSRAKSP
jgi:hypothetical protein